MWSYQFSWNQWRDKSCFYPSTFLQPVNGCKNSILNWVLNLNFFKSLQVFFYMFFYKNPRQIYSFTPLFLLLQVSNMYKTNRLNYLICNSTNKSLQLRSKNQKQAWWCRCCFFFVSAYVTHSLVERLSVLTALLGNKDKNPENVEV